METKSHACRRCGAERRPEARFCSRCGQRAQEPPTVPDIVAPVSSSDTVTTPSPGVAPAPGQHPYPPLGQPPLLPGLRPLPRELPAPEPEFWPPREPVSRPGRRGSRQAIGWITVIAVVIGAAVAILVVARPFTRLHSQTLNAAATTRSALAAGRSGALGGTPTASPGSAASPASPSPAAPVVVSARQAASSVAGMLTQSVSDRSGIARAYADAARCGPGLRRDAAVFTHAAASRRALLAGLAAMPGRSALPPALLPELAGAWRASIAADQDYARWAGDEAAGGCTANDTADPGYQAAATPDREATAGKQAFSAAWNPIAARYGLTQYQPGQL